MKTLSKPILFTIALLDYIGFTIAATIFPELFINAHLGFLPMNWTENTRFLAIGIALGLYPLGQFLSASIFGDLSDQWGRKKILFITTVGTIFSTLATAIAIQYHLYLLLFVARFVLGLFAGNVAVAQASIIDLSDAKTKAANISLIQLSLGLAWVCGAPLGSFLSNSAIFSWFNYATPFYVLTLTSTILLIVFCCYYQETLLTFNTDKKPLHPFKGISLTYQALTYIHHKTMFWVWLIFIAGWALFLQFLPTFFILNFHYTTESVGPMLAFMGGTFAATQVFIARAVLKRIPAEKILLWVMLLPSLAVIAISTATHWWSLHIAAFLFPFAMGFTLPALLTAISNKGMMHEQGNLIGKAQSIQALVTVLIALIGGHLLSYNTFATAYVGATLMLLAWLIFTFSYFKK